MSVPATLRRLFAGWLILAASGTAVAGELVDRRYIAIPPAYPAPPPGFVRLPEAPALILRDPSAPSHRPIWNPARMDVVVGIDGRGRIIHALEYRPGRFGR